MPRLLAALATIATLLFCADAVHAQSGMVPNGGSGTISPVFTGTVTLPDGSTNNATTNSIFNPAGTTTNPALTFGACGSTCGLIFPSANCIEFVNGAVNLLDYNCTSAGSWNFKTAINLGNHFMSGISALVFNGSITLTGFGSGGLQLGSTDAASPVAPSVRTQSVAGGNANTAGVDTTFIGSLSNGSGLGGLYNFQISNSNASSGVQNTGTTRFSIGPSGGKVPVTTVSALPTCNGTNEGSQYGVSDATAPTWGSTLTGGGAVHIRVYCNGTAWIAG